MRHPVRTLWLLAALTLAMGGGCASFRTDMDSAYAGKATRNEDPRPVSVLFVFHHLRQTLGYDAVPKVVGKNHTVSGFDEILGDALPELSNVGRYATHTVEAGDVNRPERRALLDSLMRASDYTVRVRLESTSRFSAQFLGTLASTVSGTLLPVPFRKDYTLKAEVLDGQRRLVGTYERHTALNTWVEALLLFVYPFHPEERKREEIYVEFFHDLFRQMESEAVLKAL